MQTDPESAEKWGRAIDAMILILGLAVAGFLMFGSGVERGPATVVVAMLCVGLALLGAEVRALRRQVARMEDLLSDVRFGAGTKRDRDAVDILIRALRTPDPEVQETALRTLRKLCGQDLGKHPEAWETWWKVSRATFTRAAPAPQK